MKRLVLLEPAEDDVAEFRDFFESRREGFGQKFMLEFRERLRRIRQFPLRYALYSGRIRLCPIRRFKVGVYYSVGETAILVVRLIDLRRGRRAVRSALRPW